MFRKLLRGAIPAVLVGAGLLVFGQASAAAAPLSGTCDWPGAYAGAWVPMNLASNSVDCFMAQGAVSPAVRTLQESMNRCYQENLSTDGEFGPLTRAALVRTQRKAGTTPDGEYGPLTRKAMSHQPINGGACLRVP